MGQIELNRLVKKWKPNCKTSSQGADNARGIKKGKSCEKKRKEKKRKEEGLANLKREGEALHLKPQ